MGGNLLLRCDLWFKNNIFKSYGKMPYVRLSEKMLYLDSCCNSGEMVLFGAVPGGFSHVVLGHNTSTLITRGNCYPEFSEPEERELSEE